MKSFKINNMEDEFLYELILGILNQACIDWHYLSIEGHFKAETHIFDKHHNRENAYTRNRMDLIKFFNSDWAETLFKAVNINNQYILRLLNENYPLPEKYVKTGKKRRMYKRRTKEFG